MFALLGLALALGLRHATVALPVLATGTLSLLFGSWIVYQIGWKDGLFLAAPHWIPH